MEKYEFTDNNWDIIIEKKILNRISSIEFVVSEKCQNQCVYCYRVKKHNASNITYVNPEVVELYMENFFEMFNLNTEFTKIRGSELFGGDALLDYQKCKQIIELLYYKYKFKNIVIPTNGRMINDLTEHDIQDLIYDRKAGKVIAHLSLSVDGIISEKQRPLSKFGKMLGYKENLDYKKLMKLSDKYQMGFHPMLSFDKPETWYETVKFFVDLKTKPYLLEIRHSIDRNLIMTCVEQLALIRTYVEQKLNKIEAKQCFNTIYPSQIPRGLGCSALTTLTIMPNGDLPFCHRLIDNPWVYGNLALKQIDISKAVTLISGYHHANHPDCIKCPVRRICSGQCAGASYEYWGDPWIPISSICDYTICKFYILSQLFDDWGKMISVPHYNIDINEIRDRCNHIYNKYNEYNKCNSLDEYIVELKQKITEL